MALPVVGYQNESVGYEFTHLADGGQLQSNISARVVSAVERLRALVVKLQASLLTSERSHDEINNISDVITILQQLDKERLTIHEELETETIICSSIRHKLKCFPNDIEVEIRAAVEAARQSNNKDITALQDKIQGSRDEIKRLETEKETLLGDINASEPDYRATQSSHADQLLLLNRKLSEKASMQITLNETVNTLKETYSKIEDYKIATEEIREEMIEDRVGADQEKADLVSKIDSTNTEISKQRRANILKKREIEEQEILTEEKDKVLQEKKKQLRKLDKANKKFKNEMEALACQLQTKVKKNTTLTQDGVKIVQDSAAAVRTLTTIQNEWKIKLAQIEAETSRVLSECEKLKTVQIKLSNEHDIAKASSSRDKNEAEETEKRLRSVKDDLLHQSDECTRLKQENTEMEAILEQIQQTHTATVEIYNKQIQDSSAAVGREKKQKHILQMKRDDIVKATKELRSSHGKQLATMQKKMSEHKTEHGRLVDYGIQLQGALKRDELAVKDYQSKIKDAKIRYVASRKKFQSDIDVLQIKIKDLEESLEEKKTLLATETPIFEDLKIDYAKTTEKFDSTKKQAVDLNNKKAAIQATVEKITFDIQKMDEPTRILWDEHSTMNSEYSHDIETQAHEIRAIEQNILVTNRKREAIHKENKRFEQAISAMEDDMHFMKSRTESIERQKMKCDNEIQSCQSWLDVKWQEDLNLDRTYYDRDVVLLGSLGDINQASSKRQAQVEDIHANFTGQLRQLFMFIDGAAGVRPVADKSAS